MKILHSLYYYRPHYSGLTVYTERLVTALGARGHQVTVITSRYERTLPSEEQLDGVKVRRLPVLLKISKGPIMPSLLYWAWRLGRESDVIHLHVPQLDAAPIALIARLLRKPVVLTYHCDLRLPTSVLNRLANWLSAFTSRLTVALANVVVANARDYAEASTILQGFLPKLKVIPPPISSPVPSDDAIDRLRKKLGHRSDQKVIGMAARLASEKGVQYLVQALPLVREAFPSARVVYVGQHLDVMGEAEYAQRLQPGIEAMGDAWDCLRVLSPEEMAAFFNLCDVTVLPSLNSTESFGMVQVESMLNGTPVVASDIPGVRQPVTQTGMGVLVQPADGRALAHGIIKVLQDPEAFLRTRSEIDERFGESVNASKYLDIYRGLVDRQKGSTSL
jgi:glycosyltransferase involved in cell wall biosynthesis